MFDVTIHRKIELLGQVMDDIKEVETAIQLTTDPSLLKEYKDERRELICELDEIGNRCIVLLEAYVQDCKDNDIPVYLDYFRVLTELKKATLE